MTETTIHFACDKCGKRFGVPSQHAGRSTKCPSCGAAITVPGESTRPDPLADLIGFSCGLCGTRMDVPSRYIGRKVKCPDCHKATVVPAPEAPKPKAAPAELEAYDVYEGEQQPRGVDLARAAKRSVHFDCPRCQTHLTAPANLAGRSVACHDCGAKVRIPQPPPEQPAKSESAQPARIGDGYEVEAAKAASEPTEGLFEHYTKHTPAGYRDRQERAGKGKQLSGRPEPTGFPVVTDLLGLFRSRSFLSVWLAIGGGIAASDGSLLMAAYVASLRAGSFGMLAIYSFIAMAVIFAVLSFGGIAAYGLAVFSQSSEGAPSVQEWPSTIPTEWWGATLQLITGLVVTASLGGALCAVIQPDAREAGALMTMTLWLALPWVLLSQIDNGSTFGVFSPRLLRTIAHAPLSWAAFYLVTALGGAMWYGTAVLFVTESPYLLLLMAPVTAFAALQYAWVLGRLAWVAAEATPDTSLDKPSI